MTRTLTRIRNAAPIIGSAMAAVLGAWLLPASAWMGLGPVLAPVLAVVVLGSLILLGGRDRLSAVGRLDQEGADRFLLECARLSNQVRAMFLSSGAALAVLILAPLAIGAVADGPGAALAGWLDRGISGFVSLTLFAAVVGVVRVAMLEAALYDLSLTSAQAMPHEPAPTLSLDRPVLLRRPNRGDGGAVGLLH